jgi:hypothetical protein
MDISGGMPSVIIKMLVASEPGQLRLLPALPRSWPTGSIEGVLARGQIEVRRLHWSPNGLEVTLRSGKAQKVVLELPWAIASISVEGSGAKVVKAGSANQRSVTLPAAQDITIKISCQR